MKWQPIETAPKDRKAILVWLPECKCHALVYWEKEEQKWLHFWDYHQSLIEEPIAWAKLETPIMTKCPTP